MKKIKPQKIKKILIALGLFFVIFYIYISYCKEIKNKDLLVSFIDSGQADAILIQTPRNQNILIDFGDNRGLTELNKKIPWWNKEIDLIIITHPHDDHILGVISVLKKYTVNQIMYTGVLHHSPAYLELLKEIESKKIPLIVPRKDQVINLGPRCQINILYPLESFQGREIANLNNSSIVSKLTCNNNTFLFMGDAEIEVEDELLKNNSDLKSDVLKAGHHGSITSSQNKFLEKVNPQIAVIMVGENNKFNHPSLRTIKKLEKLNIKTFRTDIDGTLNITSNKNGKELKIN